MEQISLTIPRQILESFPEGDSSTAAKDMERAVEGLESRINAGIEDAETEREAAGHVVDAIDHLEIRMERYDEFVPELRAWGQSPIYAIGWRNLYADLVVQLGDVGWLASHLDEERNYRIVEDGIRFSDR